MRLLLLPAAGPAQRVAALGVVPRREGVGELADPAGEVADRAEDPAHRRERAVRVERHRLPPAAAPDVPDGQPLRRDLRRLEDGRRHARAARAGAG